MGQIELITTLNDISIDMLVRGYRKKLKIILGLSSWVITLTADI